MNILEILCSYGANINAGDSVGDTALHETVSSGRVDVANFLLEHDADCTLKNKVFTVNITLD